ncbi:MAG TPA: YbaB/EbfC family nucleoid-associated protein [Chloroflexi bacterium]|nr:YbaB/EbfC family nucleoid-associated protein [Chloroflexota bacterium]
MAKKKKRKLTSGASIKAQDMLRQLQKLQDEMTKVQESLGEETIEVSAGGGVVKVVIDGHQRLRSITIDPEVVNPEDVEMLQDLILAAVNEAIERAQALAAEQMASLVGGVQIPGLMM